MGKIDRFELKRDNKTIIINKQDGKYNIIVLSDEKSTDDHGEYIKLDISDLVLINKYITEISNDHFLYEQ